MDEIITKATKAPSSVNMQPWRIAVVESDEMKEKVKESFGFNSRQLTTSSAMLIILEIYKITKKLNRFMAML